MSAFLPRKQTHTVGKVGRSLSSRRWMKACCILGRKKNSRLCGKRRRQPGKVRAVGTSDHVQRCWGLDMGLLKALKCFPWSNGGWLERQRKYNDRRRKAWGRRHWALGSNLVFLQERARNYRRHWWNKRLSTEEVCFSTDISNKNFKLGK